MKSEIEKKNEFNKRKKKYIKKWESKLEKKVYTKFWLKDKIEKKIKFNKRSKDNRKNDQIEKKNIWQIRIEGWNRK